MRKFSIVIFNYIILMLICPVVASLTPVFASVQDFYFSDFTADYYLSQNTDGTSHLKVIETLTAEFPSYEQNKGVCRQIAYTNQDGANVTLSDLTRSNIKVTRNGISEPIYSIDKENGYFSVCTGTEDYLSGAQAFTFEYEFDKVVTDFKDYQELYWDTNGNGFRQSFSHLTARVHFDDPAVWTGQSWCYVGIYGSSNQSRCQITKLDDGVEFHTDRLSASENLTFDVELHPNSFVVPEPEYNYTLVALIALIIAGCLALIAYYVHRYLTVARHKIREYRGLFVAPQYQANSKYSLPEMAEIYLGKKKDFRVGILLDMIVHHKISLQKVQEHRNKWSITVLQSANLAPYEQTLLSILNGGGAISDNSTIKLEPHTATSTLVKLGQQLKTDIISALRHDKLVTTKYHFGDAKAIGSKLSIIWYAFSGVLVGAFCWFFLTGLFSTFADATSFTGQKFVLKDEFMIIGFISFSLTFAIVLALKNSIKTISNITSEGLAASNYMAGLELYIRMAEADRMKLLQSVKGADTSPTGIVKLYEKLLPYAAIFGLEESWLKEMQDYCKVQEITEPDYLMTGLMVSDFTRALHSTASYAISSTAVSSSGSSGGGGGGFSGGGGGGGGGGGR